MPHLCCLVSRIFPAGLYQLDPQRTTTLGRAPINDVVLPHEAVSRHHAELYWEDGDYYARDLGSHNGTLVNGGVITGPWRLSPEDELRIGPFSLRFRRAKSVDTVLEDRARDDNERTARIDFTMTFETARKGGKFTGRQLMALCHLLCVRRQEGVLEVEGTTASGEIEVFEGEIRRAQSGELEGRLAAWALLAQQEGTVRLKPRATSTPLEPIPGGTASFLMDIERNLDALDRDRLYDTHAD